MKSFAVINVVTMLIVTFSSGCVSNDPYQSSRSYSMRYPSAAESKNSGLGIIESMYLIRSDNNASKVGSLAGSAVDANSSTKNKSSTSSDLHEIQVRMSNGESATVVQERVDDFRVGNRVRIVDGRVYLY